MAMGVERWSKQKKPLRIMRVEMVSIDEILPHEHIIEEEIESFCASLERKGVFFRPILLDKKTHVVLDGHHRVEGLRRLGAKSIPAVLIDYANDDEMEVHTWYPIVWEDRDKVVSVLEGDAKVEHMGESEALTTVNDGSATFCTLPPRDGDVIVITGVHETLLERLMEAFSVEYCDTADMANQIGDKGVLLYRRDPTKEEVIRHAKEGDLLPPKTTRHHLPYRYQDIRVPLSKLF